MAMVDEPKKILTFVCNICNAKASTKSVFERHHKIFHSGEKPFQCELCPKGFALRWLRDTHQETHNPQYIECEVCGKDIRTVKMKIHMRNVHELQNQRQKVICKICGKGVKGISGHLKKHEEKLKNPSQIEKCPICKKQYSFQEGKDLSMHMAKHGSAKRYQCND